MTNQQYYMDDLNLVSKLAILWCKLVSSRMDGKNPKCKYSLRVKHKIVFSRLFNYILNIMTEKHNTLIILTLHITSLNDPVGWY